MSAPSISSVLLGSSRVDEMKTWYRRAFGVTENDMGAFEFGGVQLFIEPHSEVDGPVLEPARSIINLDVEDAEGLAEHLRQLDTKYVREVERESFGLIGTVADPDGNYLQIIQWGATAPTSDGSP